MKYLTVTRLAKSDKLLSGVLACVECGIEASQFVHIRMNPKNNNATPLGGIYCPGCALVHLDEVLDAYGDCVYGNLPER